MSQPLWQAQTFVQLSASLLYQLLKLRVDVFVVEQECPYPELDELDCLTDCWHLWGTLPSAATIPATPDTPIAYARILPPNERYPGPSIGRVVIAEPYRRQGLGQQLMHQALQLCASHWPGQPVHISAQAHLQVFYARLGFIGEGETYLEDGIPHRHMYRL